MLNTYEIWEDPKKKVQQPDDPCHGLVPHGNYEKCPVKSSEKPDKVPENGICHEHLIKGCTLNHRQPNQQPDSEMKITVLPDIFRIIGPGDDVVVSTEKLLAWRDTAVRGELEKAYEHWKRDELGVGGYFAETIAQLKGGSNE